MNSSHSQHGYKGQVTGQVAGQSYRRATGLFSEGCVAASTINKHNNEKAAGPERPASAAGRGPFGLRYARRHSVRPAANSGKGELICH